MICNICIVAWNTHTHTKLWKKRKVSGSRTVVHINLDTSFVCYRVRNRQFRTYRKYCLADYFHTVRSRLCTERLICTLIQGITPCYQSLCKMGCMLIVVLRFPEIWFQRTIEHLLTIYYPTGKCTYAVDGNRSAICMGNKSVSGFLHLGRLTA